jgi:hypothetical protein
VEEATCKPGLGLEKREKEKEKEKKRVMSKCGGGHLQTPFGPRKKKKEKEKDNETSGWRPLAKSVWSEKEKDKENKIK